MIDFSLFNDYLHSPFIKPCANISLADFFEGKGERGKVKGII
jgi:hypothetical protein